MKRQKNGKFAKGNAGGPGRPELSQKERELRALNQNEIKQILDDFLQLTPYQLKKKRDDPETRMIELFVISIITHGTNKGDPIRLNFLFDRLIGKEKERFDHTSSDGTMTPQVVLYLPDNGFAVKDG